MLTSLLLFMDSTSKIGFLGQFFYESSKRKILTIDVDLTTYGAGLFPARSPVNFKIFRSGKVYDREMQKCCNLTEPQKILCFIEILQITRKTVN